MKALTSKDFEPQIDDCVSDITTIYYDSSEGIKKILNSLLDEAFTSQHSKTLREFVKWLEEDCNEHYVPFTLTKHKKDCPLCWAKIKSEAQQ